MIDEYVKKDLSRKELNGVIRFLECFEPKKSKHSPFELEMSRLEFKEKYPRRKDRIELMNAYGMAVIEVQEDPEPAKEEEKLEPSKIQWNPAQRGTSD